MEGTALFLTLLKKSLPFMNNKKQQPIDESFSSMLSLCHEKFVQAKYCHLWQPCVNVHKYILLNQLFITRRKHFINL